MRFHSLTLFAGILLLSAMLRAEPQTPKAEQSTSRMKKNLSEQLPFDDARNMTLMVFYADPSNNPNMGAVAHQNASGSGVWVGNKGYVATCQHVIAKWHGPFQIGFARNAYVAEGGITITVGAFINLLDADVVASDPDSDVAILKAHVSSPRDAEPQPLVAVMGNPVPGEQVITPQLRTSPKGGVLRTDFPAPGEPLLLAGYPIFQKTLILQVGPATGVNFPEDSTSHVASGLRIFLSLVSNPGNSGGPVLDVDGRVVGLLEANLTSPIRDGEGRQLYSPTVKYDASGNFARDASNNLAYEIKPLLQNSGISLAVPARSIAELARKNNIGLE